MQVFTPFSFQTQCASLQAGHFVHRCLNSCTGGDQRELLQGSIEELGHFNYGYFQLLNNILSFYDLDKLLGRIGKNHQLSIDLQNAIMLMLVERLPAPAVARSTV